MSGVRNRTKNDTDDDKNIKVYYNMTNMSKHLKKQMKTNKERN